MAKEYTLTEESVNLIARSIDEQGHATKPDTYFSLRRPYNATDGHVTLAMTDASGVAAMTYDTASASYTVGTGTVKLLTVDVDSKLVDYGKTITAHNCSSSAVAADAVVMIIWCDGHWFVVMEDCS